VRKQHVILKSGITSPFYFDIKKAYGNPSLIKSIAEYMARSTGKNVTCVAGTGYGGLPIAVAVAGLLKSNLALVREIPKKHGTSAWIDGYVPTKHDRVLIVDDVITSGGSIKKTIGVIKKTGAKVIECQVIVNRSVKLPDLKIPIKYVINADELV